jgi:hypothetical protein
MDISKKTRSVIEELDKFSGSKIQNRNELSILIELSDTSGKDKLFYDIQFVSKYLNGLGKILKTGISLPAGKSTNGNEDSRVSPDEAKEKIMTEYKDHMIKLTNYLNDLLIDADESVKSEITAKYLSLSRTSLVNLTTLVYDLSWLKKYYNSKRS